MVMRGAFSQVVLGLAIGIPIALLGARVIATQLYGVHAYDPLSLLIAAAVLSLAAAIAGFVPARRAASIEPMKALRSE
jgi:ABC-type antimicrobial peptide transport system permease subunit